MAEEENVPAVRSPFTAAILLQTVRQIRIQVKMEQVSAEATGVTAARSPFTEETSYSRDGAGIGGGDDGDGGNITINGGTIASVKVKQGQGARIGGGCDGAPGTVIIMEAV